MSSEPVTLSREEALAIVAQGAPEKPLRVLLRRSTEKLGYGEPAARAQLNRRLQTVALGVAAAVAMLTWLPRMMPWHTGMWILTAGLATAGSVAAWLWIQPVRARTCWELDLSRGEVHNPLLGTRHAAGDCVLRVHHHEEGEIFGPSGPAYPGQSGWELSLSTRQGAEILWGASSHERTLLVAQALRALLPFGNLLVNPAAASRSRKRR